MIGATLSRRSRNRRRTHLRQNFDQSINLIRTEQALWPRRRDIGERRRIELRRVQQTVFRKVINDHVQKFDLTS